MRHWLISTIRNPLVRFLLIGAAMYVSYAVLDTETASESTNTIRITAGELAWLEEAWRKRWNRPPTPAERQGLAEVLGDTFMLQRYYPERSEQEVAKLFGREFARAVFALSTGQWHGPVLSGYGMHLVYVHGRSHAPPPPFEAVKERVTQDWLDDKREASTRPTMPICANAMT